MKHKLDNLLTIFDNIIGSFKTDYIKKEAEDGFNYYEIYYLNEYELQELRQAYYDLEKVVESLPNEN